MSLVWHRWRAEHGAVERDAVRRLQDLEKENARLKRLVADRQPDIQILKPDPEGNARGGTPTAKRELGGGAGRSSA